jgi:hypothetical protein
LEEIEKFLVRSTMSRLLFVLFLFAIFHAGADAVRLAFETFKDLYSMNLALGRFPPMIDTRADFNLVESAELVDMPECPNNVNNTFFRCNEAGNLTYLRIESPLRELQYSPLGSTVNFDEKYLTDLDIFSYSGTLYLIFLIGTDRLRRIDIRHSYFNEKQGHMDLLAYNFFRASDELHVYNTTLVGLPFTTPPSRMPRVCNFTNVWLVCPIPQWLQTFCIHDSSVMCANHTELVSRANRTTKSTGLACSQWLPFVAPCSASCSVPATEPNITCIKLLNGANFNTFFVAQTPGFVTSELTFGLLATLFALSVRTPDVRGLVSKIELWSWAKNTYETVFEQFPPERGAVDTVDDDDVKFWLPPTRTNRVRLTWESILPLDRLGMVYGFFVYDGTPPELPPPPSVACSRPVTLGQRAWLDNTVADSFCVGHVCQDVCLTNGVLPATLANLTVGVAVVPKYVVVFGGTGTASTMSTEPSFGTRVFAVESSSASPSTRVELSGGGNVRNAKRVRVVSERTASDMTTSSEVTIAAAQVIRQLAGTWVKRLRGNVTATTYSGALAVQRTQDAWPTTFAGSTSAPFDAQNASVVAFNATSSMALVYGAANDGVLDRWWRFDATNDLMWRSIVAPLRPAYVNQSSAAAAAVAERRRVLVAVAASGASGGLVVAVGAVVNERYDGRRNSSLAARRAVQTPVDLFDVERNVWIAGVLLEHNIERPVSELQVVTTKTTATTTTIAVTTNGTMSFEFEWRPFTVALRECTEQTECSSCLQSNLTLDLCQWCGAQCLPRSAPCGSRTERCEEVTTTSSLVSTTSTATTTMTTIVNTTNANASTTASSSAAIGPVTSSSESGLSSGTVIAIAVPVAIVGTLLLAAAVAGAVIFSRRGGKGDTEMTTPTPTSRDSMQLQVSQPLPEEEDGESHSVSLSE